MNKSRNISWMPLFVIAAAAFVGALDATFMNVSMSQVVIDLNTNVGTIQKMVSFYTLITASLLLISAKLQDIIGKRKTILLLFFIFLLLIPRLHLLFSIGAVYENWFGHNKRSRLFRTCLSVFMELCELLAAHALLTYE